VKGRARTLVLLATGISWSAGCAQALGLGDYGPEPVDAAAVADASVEATVEANVGADSGTPGDAAGVDAADAGTHADAGPPDAGDAAADGPTFQPDACAGSTTCAPTAPNGWTGPLVLWEGSGDAQPGCSSNYVPVFDGGTGLSAAAAQCTCSCGPVAGSSCGSVTAQFGTGGCTSGCGTSTTLPIGSCTSIQTSTSACGTGAGVSLSGSTATGGSCQADASAAISPPAWTNAALACAPSAQSPLGCPAGQVCIPAAATPFEPHFCVLRAGSNSCPSPFVRQSLYYGGVSDGRGCGPCACGAPTGVDCNSATTIVASNPSCTAGIATLASSLPAACAGVSGAHSIRIDTTPEGGSCAPSGGGAIGSATAQTLTTLCCTQ
jgi:hypothetical protein